MQKGFSLFTPLIGTTVIVIAIMLSAVMIQNDIRISRAITSSYEQSSQEITSRLIIASVTSGIDKGIKETVKDYFSTNRVFDGSFACTNCESKMRTDLARELNAHLKSGVYTEIFNEIEKVSNYEKQPGDCPSLGPNTDPQTCISNGLAGATVATISPSYVVNFNIPSAYNNYFVVTFKDTSGTGVTTLNIKPESTTYTIPNNIKQRFQRMSNIHRNVCNDADNDGYKNYLTSTTGIQKMYVYEKAGGAAGPKMTVFKMNNGHEIRLVEVGDDTLYLPPNGHLVCSKTSAGIIDDPLGRCDEV